MTYILPAVQVSKGANLRLNNAVQRVAGTFAKNETFHMGGLDLAAVIDDLSKRINNDLGHVETVAINLGVAQGHVELGRFGRSSDTVHLLRFRPQAVLVVLLEERKRVLVGNTPLPVGVSGRQCC
jgi:hypothetical protein